MIVPRFLSRFSPLSRLLKTGPCRMTALSLFAAALTMGSNATEAAGPRPLFKSMANGQPDTLEVYVIYVQFKAETDLSNEASTTGLGTFGSEKKDKTVYTLDPGTGEEVVRLGEDYLLKHFAFAQDYFNKVSNGKVVIVPKLFPKDGAVINPVQLTYPMKNYNPAIEDKSAKQKTRDFEETRAVQLMSFVSEAAQKAMTNDPGDPFLAAYNGGTSPNKKRAFLLFHAGHSRLVDGGSLGYLGANSPNDFTDFFVTKDDFKWLAKAKGSTPDAQTYAAARRKDSLGVITPQGDTITQFMMLSESASQDGINWGINGILINQLARQMGMPDLFDVVQGISQVGYFDVMDFAGYNTMNGFLPVFPSAWVRAYMGWDKPVVAKQDSAGVGEYVIYPADQPVGDRTRTVKIPLNDREYLLVENRQRAPRSGDVTINFSKQAVSGSAEFPVNDSITVPYAALDSVFLDSVCTTYSGARCTAKEPNPKKPSGIITRVSNYDVGLPGNGLLVWHVNEWFLESFLPFGAVNAYLGDTLRSQYKGLELTEADGVPSIGKQFTDPLGQPAFDYGTGRDMLPHVYRKRKNPPKDTSWAPAETLSVIGSYGFANTNSWNDGRTHIQLEAKLPDSPIFAKGVSSFSGDSVFTLRDSAITLRVIWPSALSNKTVNVPAGSVWPVRTTAAGSPQSVNLLRDETGKAYLVSVGDTGLLQTYTKEGKLALAPRDSVRDTNHYAGVTTFLSSGNTKPDNAAGVNSLVNPAGAPLGAAVVSDSTLVVLTGSSLRFIRARADSLNGTSLNGGRDTAIAVKGKVGPLVWASRVFVIDSAGALHAFNFAGGAHESVQLPAAEYQALAGAVYGTAQHVLAAGRTSGPTAVGTVVRVDPAALAAAPTQLPLAWGAWSNSANETFTLTVSDFDRDTADDAFLLGSRGSALLFHLRNGQEGKTFMGWPQILPRSIQRTDTIGSYFTEDRSAPALTDLNRDGHPDIVFSGTNAVYAVDWRGATLPGWPFQMQPRQPVGFTYDNRKLPATVIGSSPLALSLRRNSSLRGKPTILIASPDGLIYAIDSAGKRVTETSFDPVQKKNTGALMYDKSDWPLSTGGISLDTTRSPYVNIALAAFDSASGTRSLVAQSAAGNLNVWSLTGVIASDWPVPGGDAGRSFRLEATLLDAAADAVDAKSIEEFHLFPSPLRGGIATVHLKLGSRADRARIRVYDLAGKVVKDETLTDLNVGVQPYNRTLDLRNLGPDVYSVMCEVTFVGGGKKVKWQRLGVVK